MTVITFLWQAIQSLLWLKILKIIMLTWNWLPFTQKLLFSCVKMSLKHLLHLGNFDRQNFVALNTPIEIVNVNWWFFSFLGKLPEIPNSLKLEICIQYYSRHILSMNSIMVIVQTSFCSPETDSNLIWKTELHIETKTHCTKWVSTNTAS